MPDLQGISTFHMVNSITETQHNRGTFNKIKELFGKVIIQISKLATCFQLRRQCPSRNSIETLGLETKINTSTPV